MNEGIPFLPLRSSMTKLSESPAAAPPSAPTPREARRGLVLIAARQARSNGRSNALGEKYHPYGSTSWQLGTSAMLPRVWSIQPGLTQRVARPTPTRRTAPAASSAARSVAAVRGETAAMAA